MTGSFSPEGGSADFSEFEEGFGELDDEVTLALNGFDRARNMLHDAVANTVAEMTELEVYQDELSSLGSQATVMFGAYVQKALAAEPRETVEQDLLLMWRQDDQERSAVLSGVFEGDSCFIPYQEGQLEDLLGGIFSEENDSEYIPDIAAGVYGSVLSDELNLFAQHVEKMRDDIEHEEEEAEYARTHQLPYVVGAHLLDIAKIAVGAAIGAWAYKKVSSR